MTRLSQAAATPLVLMLAGTVALAQYGTGEWFEAGSRPELYRMGPDEEVKRGGQPTLTIQSLDEAAETLGDCNDCFGTYMRAGSAEPRRGKKIRFSASVRTRDLERWAGLWLRVDGPGGKMLAFDNMQGRPIEGDTNWTRYEVVLPVDQEAIHVAYGLLVSGAGRAWMDDAVLEEVGDDVATTGMNHPSCGAPKGWICAGSRPADYDMGVDQEVRRGGDASAFLGSKGAIPEGFGTLLQSASAAPYRGKRVRLSGWVKSMDVEPGWAGLWLRVDGQKNDKGMPKMLAFDNMQDRPITGTSEWTRYEIVLDVADEAQELFYGVLLDRTGAVWMDDLRIDVVSEDVPVTGIRSPTQGPRNLDFEER